MNVYDRSGNKVIQDYDKLMNKVSQNAEASRQKREAMEAQWAKERAAREAQRQTEKARKEAEERAKREAAERAKIEHATAEANKKAQQAAVKKQLEQNRVQEQTPAALTKVGNSLPRLKGPADSLANNNPFSANIQGPISMQPIDPSLNNKLIPQVAEVHPVRDRGTIANETDLDRRIQGYLSAGKLTKEQKQEARAALKDELARRREFGRANKGDLNKLSEFMIPGTDEYKRAQNYDDLNAKVNSNFGYGLVSPFAKIAGLAQTGIDKLTGNENSLPAQQLNDFYSRDRLAAEQAPITHGVGNFVGQAGIYSATSPIFDAGAEALGVTSNLGKFAVNQLAQNAQDLALDTAPTYNQNISMGMSEDEAKKEALKGIGANAAGNLIMGAGSELIGNLLPKLKNARAAEEIADTVDDIPALQAQKEAAEAEMKRLSEQIPKAPKDIPEIQTPNKVVNSPIEAGVSTRVDNPASGNMKVSQAYDNTLRNSDLLTEEEFAKTIPENFMYETVSEEESMKEGARLLREEGENFVQNRLQKEGFTSADTDGMMQAYRDKIAEARALEEAGNIEGGLAAREDANIIFRKIQQESSRGGQAIQALAKWSRNTPEGMLAEAEHIVNTRLTKPGAKDGISKTLKDKMAKAADAKAVRQSEALFANFTDRLRQSIDASGYTGKTDDVIKLDQAIQQFDDAVKSGDIGNIKNSYNALTRRLGNMENKGVIPNVSTEEVKDAIANLSKTSKAEGFNFSVDFQRDFLDAAAKLQDIAPDSREYKEAMARLGKKVGEEIRRNTPATKLTVQRITTYLMDNMLGNFRTLITRNAGGNVGLNVLEQTTTRPLAAALDRLVSLKTGMRTQAGASREALAEYLSGFFKGLKEEGQDFAKGLHTARSGEVNIRNAIDSNGHIFGTDSNVVPVKAVSWLADKADALVRHGLSVGDRPFYEAVYKQTLGDMNRLRATGQMGEAIQKLSDAEFKQLAEATAKMNGLTAVYQNDSLLSDALLGFKQSISELSKGTLGVDILSQFTMPFVKTPANVIDRAIDYSPLGMVRNTIRTVGEGGIGGKNFNQNRFVNETARNLIGTGLMAGAGVAAKEGLISGKYSDDKDEKQAQRNRGMQQYALNIPKLNENSPQRQMDISWIPIVGSNAVASAAAVNAANDPEMGGEQKALAGLQAGGQALFDQSMFQGLQRLFGQGESYNTDKGIVGNMSDTVLQGTTQFVPSLARQIGQVADPLQRDLSNGDYTKNNFINSVPGLRETLQPRVDSEGNYMQENQGRGIGSKILEDMILPGKITEIKDIPLDTEAQRLQALTGNNIAYQPKATKREITTDDHTPTPEEFTQYQVDRNYAMTNTGNKLMNTDYYKLLTPTEQEEMLDKVYKGVKDYTQSQYVDHELTTAAGKAYAENGSDGAISRIISNKIMDDNDISKGSKVAGQINDMISSGNVDGAKELVDLYNDTKKKSTTKSEAGEDVQKKADLMNEIMALPEDKQAQMYDAFSGKVLTTKAEKAAYEKSGAKGAIAEYKKAQAEAERKAKEKAAKQKEAASAAGVSVQQLGTLREELARYGAIDSDTTVKYYNHAKQTIPGLTTRQYVDTLKTIGGEDRKISQKEMLNYFNTHDLDADKVNEYWNAYGSWKKVPVLKNGKYVAK